MGLMSDKCKSCDFWDYDNHRCSAYICCKRECDVSLVDEIAKLSIETKKSLTQEDIDDIISKSEIITMTMFNKTTIVIVKLENGFVFVESSSCVSPENYDMEIGKKICMERIENKLWELEGYKLHVNQGGRTNAF